MSNIPVNIPAFTEWANQHQVTWLANAVAIGLTTAQANAFKALTQTNDAKFTAAEAARQAAKNATTELHNSLEATRAMAGELVGVIKAFAESTNNPGVYALAGLNPPAPRGVVPPPNAPTDFTANVNPDGSLTIKWKASQPTGASAVQYLVFRRLNATGNYTLVSTVGKSKTYTDQALPAGVDKVEYIVQPKRGDTLGPAANAFVVQFGGGTMSTSFVESAGGEMKLAA